MSNRIIGASLVAGLAFTATAALAVPTVTITDTITGTGIGTNSFQTELNNAGAGVFIDTASFSLNERARLTFTAIAAESSFNNTFTGSVPAECQMTP